MNRRSTSLSGALGEDRPLRPRRAERFAVDQASNLRSQSWHQVEVKVRNVSASGFMAECPALVQIGSYVSLDVPGIGPVQAQVRWQLGLKMGGLFLDPISLVRCEWTATQAESQDPA
jgi:hypothetical protein